MAAFKIIFLVTVLLLMSRRTKLKRITDGNILDATDPKASEEINSKLIKVDFFYETLCPRCIDHFHDQITPTYNQLGSYLDLHLVPFGADTVEEKNGKIIMECHHGPEECYGNKLHACAIDIIKNVTEYVKYLDCLMTRNSTNEAADKCADKLNISKDIVKHIKDCANSDKGLQLLLIYKAYYDKYNHCGIPAIAVNDESIDYYTPLKPYICKLLGNAPPPCKTHGN